MMPRSMASRVSAGTATLPALHSSPAKTPTISPAGAGRRKTHATTATRSRWCRGERIVALVDRAPHVARLYVCRRSRPQSAALATVGLVSILSWIFVGLIAGLLARWIVRDDRSGCLYTIAVGVLGTLIGGALMQWAGHQGVNEFDIRSILVSTLGAILLLLVLGAIRGRRSVGR